MKAKLLWLWFLLATAVAVVVAWVTGKDRAEREESRRKAADFKAKVAEVQAEQAARKAETDAAVAKVDEAARVDVARDPVALANDLIHDGRGSSDPITKG